MTDEMKAALKALELYGARHPRPPQVNQKQAAEMLHVTARVESMERSTSWRITAPLRGLKTWLLTWSLRTRSYDKHSA